MDMIGEFGMSAKEIFAEIDRVHSELLRVGFGIPFLDDALLGLFAGETTLVGARTGGGKTEFATQVLLHQQSGDNAKAVLYFALDHEQGEIEKRLLYRLLVERFRMDASDQKSYLRLRYAEWRAGNYSQLFAAYENELRMQVQLLLSTSETRFLYKKGELDAEEIAGMIQTRGSDFNLIIVDHFHALRFSGDRFDSQSRSMRVLAQAAQQANRPLLILGQFKKRGPANRFSIPDLEEFSGPMDLMYIPNNIVVFAPNTKDKVGFGETFFHVAKARIAADSKAFVGVHSFNLAAKTYSDKYTLKKFLPYSEPEDLLPGAIPNWAKHAWRGKLDDWMKK